MKKRLYYATPDLWHDKFSNSYKSWKCPQAVPYMISRTVEGQCLPWYPRMVVVGYVQSCTRSLRVEQKGCRPYRVSPRKAHLLVELEAEQLFLLRERHHQLLNKFMQRRQGCSVVRRVFRSIVVARQSLFFLCRGEAEWPPTAPSVFRWGRSTLASSAACLMRLALSRERFTQHAWDLTFCLSKDVYECSSSCSFSFFTNVFLHQCV